MKLIITTFFFLSISCSAQNNDESEATKKERQDSIINKYVHNCAKNYNFYYEMKEWQSCLDKGLEKDSTIAYLWQQKAMPYFKIKKYEAGMKYLDKAVEYNAGRWQPYRGFIKCIFSKTYKDAIKDFEECKTKWGDNYEMDHTYSFYIGLSYLQLNEFEKAETYFNNTITEQENKFKEAHYLDLFYYAITKYELQKYEEAIVIFNKVIEQYSEFSEAIYYKALCLRKQNKSREAYETLIIEAQEYAKQGYTINEDNAVYELYPYQVKWK
jgi:tetratricopeptide (TPR) repeat protein